MMLRDRMPAYISWDMFERNQRQLKANQSKHIGVARGGPSLLTGILICGRCGSPGQRRAAEGAGSGGQR